MKRFRVFFLIAVFIGASVLSMGIPGQVYFDDGLSHTISDDMYDGDEIYLDKNIANNPGTYLLFEEGASAFGLYAYNHSVIDITGGDIVSDPVAHDYSTINMSGGEVSILTSDGDSTVNMSGGYANDIWAAGNSIVNLSGGTVGGLSARYSSIIYLEGLNFKISGSAGEQTLSPGDNLGDFTGYNRVTGTLANGDTLNSIFSIYDTADIIILPEPATISLLLLGGMSLLRKRR